MSNGEKGLMNGLARVSEIWKNFFYEREDPYAGAMKSRVHIPGGNVIITWSTSLPDDHIEGGYCLCEWCVYQRAEVAK